MNTADILSSHICIVKTTARLLPVDTVSAHNAPPCICEQNNNPNVSCSQRRNIKGVFGFSGQEPTPPQHPSMTLFPLVGSGRKLLKLSLTQGNRIGRVPADCRENFAEGVRNLIDIGGRMWHSISTIHRYYVFYHSKCRNRRQKAVLYSRPLLAGE